MSSRTPMISVVTATMNSGKILPRLLNSLAEQTFRGFELVVQDGGSKDDTVAVVESFRNRLSSVKVKSEKDSGIYQAWNRAIERTSGDWVIFLGSDDQLASERTLEEISRYLNAVADNVRFVCGGVILLDGAGRVRSEIMVNQSEIGRKIRRMCPVPHSSLFTRLSCLKAHRFDESFQIAGDYDFLAETYTGESDFFVAPFVVTLMQDGGVSTNRKFAKLLRKENLRVVRRYYPFPVVAGAYVLNFRGALSELLREYFPVLNRIKPRQL